MDVKQLSKERFNQTAEGYVNSPSHAKGTDLTRMVTIADPQPGWRVLDVATGGGHTALAFARHTAHVTATDIAANMLEKSAAFIREQGVTNVDFREADAENLPFEAGSFDLVTCRIAPHHFPDVGQFVNEAARVLQPGGLLLVQDQMVPSDEATAAAINAFEKLRDPSHNRALSQATWIACFQAAGLTVTHTEHVVKRHPFLRWAALQNCSSDTIAELVAMVANADDALSAWLDPQAWGSDDASFVNRHLLIAGRKPAL